MEWITGIVNSGNFIPGVFAVFVITVTLLVLAKKGYFSFNIKGLKLGSDENERRIIRLQIEYSKSELDTYFEALIKSHKNFEWFQEWKCRTSKELVYDVIIEAIALNHITTDEFYIKGKMIKIWAELSKLSLSEEFSNDAFKEICYKEVEKIIKNLVAIRKYYSSHTD